ncbi:MAG: MCE family protein [Caulobacteraceae bacterium]|nr:MCE family protein [Caulobacteraceae bacterium]
MERNAHYAAIGLATLVLFLGLILFVVWLARFQFAKEYDLYDIVFYGPVRGLSEGGEVHFNGIKVGEVTDLQLDRKNPNKVIARARLQADVPIKTDSRAMLEPQGITGVNYIQITAGGPRSPLLRAGLPDDAVPVIMSQPSPFSELLQGSGTVLASAVEALNRVNRVLSDENISNFSNTVKNVDEITAELKARKALFAKMEVAIENAGKAAAEFEALSRSGRNMLEGDGARALRNLERASKELEDTAREAKAMIANLNGPTTDFANNGLPQLTEAVDSLQRTSESLNQLIEEARANPQGLVAKPPAQEIEVQP